MIQHCIKNALLNEEHALNLDLLIYKPNSPKSELVHSMSSNELSAMSSLTLEAFSIERNMC